MVRNAYKTTKPQRPRRTPAGAYYLLQDLLYRAVALTNSGGQIVEAYDCEAYGNTLIFNGPDTTGNWWGDAAVQSNYGANDTIYCGYRYDAESQLYYVRNRTYNQIFARWLERDPIDYAGGISRYEYVGRTPTARETDPNGELSGFWRWDFGFAACVDDNDPVHLILARILVALAGVQLPKSLVARIAAAVSDVKFANALGRPIAGASRFTTIPSVLSHQLELGGRNVLRAFGRLAAPFDMAYGLLLAQVESWCGYYCCSHTVYNPATGNILDDIRNGGSTNSGSDSAGDYKNMMVVP